MAKAFIKASEQEALMIMQRLVWANPFEDERAQLEEELLARFAKKPGDETLRAVLPIYEEQTDRLRERRKTVAPRLEEQEIYENLAFFLLFHQFREEFDKLIEQAHERGHANQRIACYDRFVKAVDHWLPDGVLGEHQGASAAHLFAVFFQIRRAFYHIQAYLVGRSAAARSLRARVWQSIFTHNMQRYQRALTDRMGDIITLVTGPSGSGKEQVARAVGLSRFIPFDTTQRSFVDDFIRGFYAINLSALSSNLIESELFGHRKGAFTGALQDRSGYLEVCGPYGTVFLDEIGETEPAIQIKLLRLLQTRTFQRIGDTAPRIFRGKLLAATNRDLAHEIREGRFRADFFFRLNADRIETPALSEILRGDPDELEHLVRFIAQNLAGADEEASLTREVGEVIARGLPEYRWPGNFRELEQCVRNVLVHGDYQRVALDSGNNWVSAAAEGALTANALLSAYIRQEYAREPNFEALGRRLEMDRRTVKKYYEMPSS